MSRKFLSKFRTTFRDVLLKSEVLGQVQHYFIKKEYQAHGAPHYHYLLWIKDAPVVGESGSQEVTVCNDKRITCHISDKETNPELYDLMMKYQVHKCCAHCKWRRMCKNTFVTRCGLTILNSPVKTTLHSVSSTLKSRKKIYNLKHDKSEIRVNPYNPLLLLWGANIDIQFVAAASQLWPTMSPAT